jgi:RecJ-like exonuclease
MHDDFNDTLDDIIGGAPRMAPKPEFKTRLERAEQRQDFTERCKACGGSGRWRGFRKCFKCDGTGKLTFRTSPEARAKGRMKAAEKRELKAELAAQWREEHKAEIEWLQHAKARNEARNGTFGWPADVLEKLTQYGTLTDGQLATVHRLMLRDAERASKYRW